MPVIKGPITTEGALVQVQIGWSHSRAQQLRLAKRAVPYPITVAALIDPGAEVTCLDAKLIEDLELPFGSSTFSNAPALQGFSISSFYHASVVILNPSGRKRDHLLIRNLSAMELPLALLDYQVLIGRDVLSRCLLLYNGIGSRFTLKY